MAEVTNRLPYAISERLASTSNNLTQLAGRAIDYALAGVPFLSAASKEFPFSVETAQMQRDQFDNEQEPGEQSLQGWWLRSQESWHGGAGAKFQEPRGAETPSTQFFDSQGVDVWTEGEAKLLRRMVQTTPAGAEATCVFAVGDTIFFGAGTTICKSVISSGSVTVLHTAAGEDVVDIVAGREQWYAVTQQGNVYMGLVAGGGIKSFPLTNPDTPIVTNPQLIWAKHRLFATYGRRLYVVDTTAADATPMAHIYMHPTTDWSYTSLADGPSAVYAGGWSEAESAIQKIVLNNDGTTPTLTGGITTAVMPPGESVERLAVLAGTWIGIGTTKGFRVGGITDGGDIQYGPAFIDPDDIVSTRAVAPWGKFFYVSFRTEDSAATVYRVDVSRQNEDGSFPYAKDAFTDTQGYFNDLDVIRDRVVAAFFAGVYPAEAAGKFQYQHATELVETGFIQFSQVRFRTTEPKIFKYLTIDAEPLAGTIVADATLEGGSTLPIITYDTQGAGDLPQAAIATSLGPQRQLGLKLTLQRSVSDATAGPVVHSYSIKALPAVKPQRIIRLPLMCFDREMWHTGQEDGYDGWAKERLSTLQSAEDSGDLVLWQDFSSLDGSTGHLVKIDRMIFQQAAPPNPVISGRGYGGVLVIELRTVD